MSVTSPVIPLLGLLTLVVPLMGVLMALTPYLMPKRECFAVTVPDDVARDPYLRRLKRTYLAIMLALAAAATIACAAALALDPEHAFVATLVVAALVLCVGGYALMLYFRAKVQRYKKAQGWVAEGRRSAGFIGDEPFPKPLSLAWDLLYVPVILITLAMGIVGYPAMPDKVPLHMDLAGKVNEWAGKSPGVVAFPVLFVLFIAVCLTVAHWVILRSKKGSDPAMPAASAWAYGMFARAQSVLLVGMGQPILVVLIVALILSSVLAKSLSHRIVQPLNKLDLEHPLENDAYEELAPLLGRINRQHLQIDEQMDELQRQQTEFSQITSSMREGLVLLDEKEHVLSINPAAEKLFGTDESCVGQDFLTIDRSHDMSLAIERAMDEGHSEARVERDGRIWQFDVSRIGASGAAVGAVLLAFDITERETAEQTRREFTANVSHELKTPLQGIIGSAELLENGMVKQEDVPRFVGHIRKEAQRLVTLIGDIIRLSQLDEGDEMPRETVDLLTLSQEAADDLKTAAAEKHIAIAVEGGSETIGGVRRLLYEVIYNLCDNAIKYNVEGGSVTMSVGERDGKAFVSVADTGIGIAPEHQSRIFERFYRVDKSHSKASGGTGLGLSIVKHAVQYHHGTVELHSEEGKGTTICILLPKE